MPNGIEADSASLTEIHRVIFRIDTGQIVAIETIWAEQEVGLDQPEMLYQRLNAILQGFSVQAGQLDVLTIHVLPVGAMRVDLATRTLVALPQGHLAECGEPAQLVSPVPYDLQAARNEFFAG